MGSQKGFQWIPLPPLVVGVILPYLASLLDVYLPEAPFGPARWLGVLFFLGGCLLSAASVSLIYTPGQWETTPYPRGVPKQLVIIGPYRYVRNPMLLGILLIVLGEGFYFQSLSILSYMAAFFIFVNLLLLPGEERRLEERFGENYLHYKEKVHRWLPTASPYK